MTSKLSFVISFSNASLFSLTITLLKKFLIGFRSGLLDGILKTFAYSLLIAFIAIFEFCRGHPSMRNHVAFGFEEFSNAFSRDDLTIAANFSPGIGPSYCSQRTAPLP